ncbi:MAG: hypothetical protein NUV47_02765 [Patescibacteria group bacterium]|nr:hypothetical protein [Patescibacteria group bacterium]
MNDVSKFVKSLSAKEQIRIEEVISKMESGDINGLDIKKLKGYSDMFRVRIGNYRIICRHNEQYGFVVVKVTRRNDTTYNF